MCVRVCVFMCTNRLRTTHAQNRTRSLRRLDQRKCWMHNYIAHTMATVRMRTFDTATRCLYRRLYRAAIKCARTCSIYVHHKFAIYSCIVYILFAAYAHCWAEALAWRLRLIVYVGTCVCVFMCIRLKIVACLVLTFTHARHARHARRATTVGRLCRFVRAEATGKPRNLTNPMEWSTPERPATLSQAIPRRTTETTVADTNVGLRCLQGKASRFYFVFLCVLSFTRKRVSTRVWLKRTRVHTGTVSNAHRKQPSTARKNEIRSVRACLMCCMFEAFSNVNTHAPTQLRLLYSRHRRPLSSKYKIHVQFVRKRSAPRCVTADDDILYWPSKWTNERANTSCNSGLDSASGKRAENGSNGYHSLYTHTNTHKYDAGTVA